MRGILEVLYSVSLHKTIEAFRLPTDSVTRSPNNEIGGDNNGFLSLASDVSGDHGQSQRLGRPK